MQQNSIFGMDRKSIILIGVAVVALLAGLVAYSQLTFRVTKVEPGQNTTITSLTKTVVLNFNKELAPFDRTTQISGGEGIVTGSKVTGSKLYIQLGSMEDNQSYKLTLSGISSTGGAVLNEYTYSFKYKYDPNASTPEDKSSNDPLVRYLPVSTDQYYIDYQLLDQPTADGKTEKLTVALLLTNEDLAFPQKVADYKKAALDYLDSKGILLSNYVVEYSPPEVAP